MANAKNAGKLGLQELTQIPRMVGETDMRLIRELAGTVPRDARIVEFGPWLGGVSIELSRHGELHVVDRFVWSEANAEKYPGLANPGENFRPLFEELIADHGASAIVHESAFDRFEWNGDAINLCFIDGPRRPADLLDCLVSIASSLTSGARVLVKNALNPRYVDMMAFVHVLAALDIFQTVETDQPQVCNIAVLEPGPNLASLSELSRQEPLFSQVPLRPEIRDPWGGPLLVLSRLAQRIAADADSEAYEMLAGLPADLANIYGWDRIEAALELSPQGETALAVFSDVLAWHNDRAAHPTGFVSPARSLGWVFRAAWSNNADNPARPSIMQPAVLAEAFDAGEMTRAETLGARGMGRHVIEIGYGLGLAGPAHVAGGVASYLGIELGELTPAMLRAEGLLSAVTYMPLETADMAMAARADLLVLRSSVQESAAASAFADRLRKRFPAADVIALEDAGSLQPEPGA